MGIVKGLRTLSNPNTHQTENIHKTLPLWTLLYRSETQAVIQQDKHAITSEEIEFIARPRKYVKKIAKAMKILQQVLNFTQLQIKLNIRELNRYMCEEMTETDYNTLL